MLSYFLTFEIWTPDFVVYVYNYTVLNWPYPCLTSVDVWEFWLIPTLINGHSWRHRKNPLQYNKLSLRNQKIWSQACIYNWLLIDLTLKNKQHIIFSQDCQLLFDIASASERKLQMVQTGIAICWLIADSWQ